MAHSDSFQHTKVYDEIDLAFSWTGGTAPVTDDGGSNSLDATAPIAYQATGKFTVKLNTLRPRKAFGVPKLFVYVQPKADGTDADLKVVPQSYDPTTGLLVLWTYGLTQGTGVGASCTLTADTNANMADGDTVTLNSGFGAPVVYEYDKSGNGVTAGHVAVTAGTTAATVAANFRTAILANQPALNVTDNGDGTLTIKNRWPGAAGNNTNSKTSASALAITNFTGGLDASAVAALRDPDPATTIMVNFRGSEHA